MPVNFVHVCQGIENIQERKLHNFFPSMVTMTKIIEELFTPTLNGIAVGVWYSVVYASRSTRWVE